MLSNFSRFFSSLSFCCYSSATSILSHVSLLRGKVLIGLFPKLFLIKDKQRLYISFRDMGSSAMSQSFVQSSIWTEKALNVDQAKELSSTREGVDECLENNTSATSEWETWEVRLWSQLVVAHPIIISRTVRQRWPEKTPNTQTHSGRVPPSLTQTQARPFPSLMSSGLYGNT